MEYNGFVVGFFFIRLPFFEPRFLRRFLNTFWFFVFFFSRTISRPSRTCRVCVCANFFAPYNPIGATEERAPTVVRRPLRDNCARTTVIQIARRDNYDGAVSRFSPGRRPTNDSHVFAITRTLKTVFALYLYRYFSGPTARPSRPSKTFAFRISPASSRDPSVKKKKK